MVKQSEKLTSDARVNIHAKKPVFELMEMQLNLCLSFILNGCCNISNAITKPAAFRIITADVWPVSLVKDG